MTWTSFKSSFQNKSMAAAPPCPFSFLHSLLHSQSSSSTSSLSLIFPSAPSSHSSFHSLSHSQSLSLNFVQHHPTPALPQATNPSVPAPPVKTGRFLGPDDPDKLRTLQDFCYHQDFDHGSLEIRPMKDEELDETVGLLSESFAESMVMPARYVQLLAFLVKQYIRERLALVPHMTVLVGIYREKNEEESKQQLACAAEISFDAVGANAAPPTPTPPPDCPYICNMSVTKKLRRRKIGTHLLEACETLISKMKAERRVYLHCRVIDAIPFNIYKKAGYKVVKTDSILIWLTLQRRKYLMCKELQPESDGSMSGSLDCDDRPV